MTSHHATVAHGNAANPETRPPPFRTIRRGLNYVADRQRYDGDDSDYRAEAYWAQRHARYGFDLRGVGHNGLSAADNERMYSRARETFLAACRAEGIRLPNCNVLDIGCGTGFYAEVMRDEGVTRYTGLDIADTLFPDLRRRFDSYTFSKLDVSVEPIEGEYDLVIMIDVTQHITSDTKFASAMRNVHEHLARDGVFVVTSWLRPKARLTFYETARPMEAYREAFDGFRFSKPVPFRDKYLFTVRKPALD